MPASLVDNTSFTKTFSSGTELSIDLLKKRKFNTLGIIFCFSYSIFYSFLQFGLDCLFAGHTMNSQIKNYLI